MRLLFPYVGDAPPQVHLRVGKTVRKGLSLRVLLPLILWPVVEIVLFVLAGDLIGLWPTLGLVLATTALGVMVLRTQGLANMAAMAQARTSLQNPAEPMASGALRMFAGVLLVLPGFLSDALGLLLLLPPVRKFLLARMGAKISVMGAGMPPGMGMGGAAWPPRPSRGYDDVIDGEATEITPQTRSLPGQGGPRPPSGWQDRDQ